MEAIVKKKNKYVWKTTTTGLLLSLGFGEMHDIISELFWGIAQFVARIILGGNKNTGRSHTHTHTHTHTHREIQWLMSYSWREPQRDSTADNSQV